MSFLLVFWDSVDGRESCDGGFRGQIAQQRVEVVGKETKPSLWRTGWGARTAPGVVGWQEHSGQRIKGILGHRG